MHLLVTGGAGYIGSHACRRLLEEGHSVVVLDNLFRGHRRAIDLLRTLPGVTPDRLVLVEGDVADPAALDRAFSALGAKVDAVLHFAAVAYVRESVDEPLLYYRNNTAAAVALIEALDRHRVERFVFSSTCATYGEAPPHLIPITEDCPQRPINPYGWSKLFIERMLTDFAGLQARRARPFALAMLRYFNVAGCDRNGLLGEDHTPETHLIPILLQCALGRRESFTLLGDDHPTPDGTCVRDYIHVEDLVDAHVTVMNALEPGDRRTYNLGIGKGLSIRDIIASAERITGARIPITTAPRHPGDPPTLYCDPSRIARDLNWRARVTDTDHIIDSAWRWLRAHPDGYARP